MKQLLKSSAIGGAVLGGFAVLAALLLGVVNNASEPAIEANKQLLLEQRLTEVLPKELYDNDLLADKTCFDVGLPRPIAIFRARLDGQPNAAVFSTYTPRGYSGDIELVVGMQLLPDSSVQVTGVRATDHKETPGLGDKIEADRNDWILEFTGLSFDKLPREQWAVQKDGGAFDQFTGATITPRAVVAAVRQSVLQFSGRHQDIFAQAAVPSDAVCE